MLDFKVYADEPSIIHEFSIALGVVLGGVVSLAFPDALLSSAPLNRAILASMAFFWFFRLPVEDLASEQGYSASFFLHPK